METQPRGPVLGALETQLSFEEAQSLCAMEDAPIEAFAFTGGGAPGAPLAKSEWRGCALKSVCLRGADLRGAYFCDVLFHNCDFAGAALVGATLHRGRISAPAPWRMCAFPAAWRKAPLFPNAA